MDVLEAEFVTEARDPRTLPPPAFAEIAFAGRSNVGKSSLINALAHRKKLARTSSLPGATRGIHLYRLRLRGDATLDFVDLPGYGYAQRSKSERKTWGPMVEGLLTQRAGLRTVVLIVDVRRGIEPDDVELVDFLRHHDRQIVLVATKTDKLAPSKRKLAIDQVGKAHGLRVHGFSATTNEGRDALWRTLLRASGLAITPPQP